MNNEIKEIINGLKVDLSDWSKELNSKIENDKKSVTREVLFNFMVLSEFLNSGDHSSADIKWLLLELTCGKFKFYLNLYNSDVGAVCKQYIKMNSNEILNDKTHQESILREY